MNWTQHIESFPFFGIILTIACYWLGTRLFSYGRNLAILNPTVLAIILVGLSLHSLHIPYDAYFKSAQALHFLLGPATIALAFPLAKNLHHLKDNWLGVLIAVNAGAVTGIVSGMLLTKQFGGGENLAVSMAPKATTTPIAIGISETLGGSTELTAVFAVCGGIVAVIALPMLTRFITMYDWRALGLGASTGGSGLATSLVAPMHPLAAAFAGIGLSLNGVFTAIWAPLLVPFLSQFQGFH